ncbi:MAG TPA: nucleoside deaminase [Acidimicrobiia bacterium]|nr:nucleoside deaminase [Acidimicrobiia bacterium]
MLEAWELDILRRCIDLSREAVEAGDEPFGSVLADGDGNVLREERNRVVTSADVTAHPELALASWASGNLSPEERSGATIYTSAEHCPMCAAAQVWSGVGRLVFVLAGPATKDLKPGGDPAIDLPARELISRSNVPVTVVGPVEELQDEALAVFADFRDQF